MRAIALTLAAILFLAGGSHAAKAQTVEELATRIEEIIRLLEGADQKARTGARAPLSGETLSNEKLLIPGIDGVVSSQVLSQDRKAGEPARSGSPPGAGEAELTAGELRALLTGLGEAKARAEAAAPAPPAISGPDEEDINERLRRIRQDELREEAVRNGGLVVIPFQQ